MSGRLTPHQFNMTGRNGQPAGAILSNSVDSPDAANFAAQGLSGAGVRGNAPQGEGVIARPGHVPQGQPIPSVQPQGPRVNSFSQIPWQKLSEQPELLKALGSNDPKVQGAAFAALSGMGSGYAFANPATVGPFDQTQGNRNPVLESWAKLLENNALVGEYVCPVVRVAGDVCDIAFFDENTQFQIRKLAGSRSSTPSLRRFGYTLERTTLDEIFIERTFLPSMANRGPLVMGQAITNGLVNDIKLLQEYFLAQKVFDPALYNASFKSTPATKWTSASATPFDDVFNVIPNVIGNQDVYILFGFQAWLKFQVHQNVIDKVNGSVGGIVTEEQVAAKLGVREVRVGKAKYLDGSTMTDIWGDHVLIFARTSNVGPYITGFDASAFYIYRNDVPEILVQNWQTMDFGIGGDYYQAAVIQKFVKTGSNYLAYLLYDVVS